MSEALDPRVESLARYLCRASGYVAPGMDEETLVTPQVPAELDAPVTVYAAATDAFPVWQTYVPMARAALEWVTVEAGKA